MPRLRWNLSKHEQLKYFDLGQELNAAGAELDLAEFQTGDTERLDARQLGEAYASTVGHASVYVVQLSIVALAHKVILSDFSLTCPEWDLKAYFPDEPAKDLLYRLADGSTFHADQVLNHRVGPKGTLRRGDQLEGLLLGQAFEPIPTRYMRGDRMQLILTIRTQLGRPTEWPLVVCVQQPVQTVNVLKIRRTSVFEDGSDRTKPARAKNSAKPAIPVPAGSYTDAETLGRGRI